MNDLPSFDAVHIISDLHMGGKPGFQILREGPRLAKFIRRVAAQRPGGEVALVLNGDVIDTLAEDLAGYVAVDEAIATLARIMADPAFSDVFAALAEFVRTDRRSLVVVIGNHDVEMAFPTVQRQLRTRLCGGDAAARGRLEFSTAGAGYTCLVGGNRVHCIHGNEVDAWNYNRYEDLARVSRRLNAGRSLLQSEWSPNAGTRMVKDVMNKVKQRYAWIDLLKPEAAAAARTLLAIDPSQAKAITELFGVIGERVKGSVEVDQRLSADGFMPPLAGATRAVTVQDVLGPLGRAPTPTADDHLRQTEREFAAPGGGAAATLGDGRLDTGGFVWDSLTGWLRGLPEGEALRRALVDWLKGDTSFKLDDEDDTFKEVVASIGPGIDFIVAGHTHLERAIDIGGRYYFNTGTWIRLLQFTPAMLADTASFQQVYAVLKDGSMAAIDKGLAGMPLVKDQTSSVCIAVEGDQVVGTLNHVIGDGSGAPQPVQRFARSLR